MFTKAHHWSLSWDINPAHTLVPCIFDSLYSRIPLIWYPGDLADTNLSHILDYQTVPKFCSQTLENVHVSVIFISS
jgi:hypothetical protein